ncbi:TetR family transcriptional regulator [Nocardia donostiensis]|uniref:TetR family transcriptional regulator n=2 Tax=Nocardia donostiensis TaxID=1538463 RepID=A0A1W0BA72_9NOCA|nr:TetR/AcrR family transcriptional regulator [Nocardia donostiensis]ONM46685.1 TetR family transcriptional regulator [Nocardia donostiensis]OQS12766.1 TetR family transcriptional regulator [Nocardia donostiensis]OQS19308.1 TetR family transcriptional regulator [Nocardia donostiensis]
MTPARTDGRARRWDRHRADRRERILTAALEAVQTRGSDVGVQEIADLAQVPRSVLYRLFKDRQDLDEQLRARILDDLMADLAPTLDPEGTVAEAIARAVNAYVGWIAANPRLHHFLGAGSARQSSPNSQLVSGTKIAIAARVRDVFENILQAQSAPVQLAEPLAFGLIGFVDGSVNRWLSRSMQPLDAAELSSYLQEVIWAVIDSSLRNAGVMLNPMTPISSVLTSESVDRLG